MEYVDHEPGAWFLVEEEGLLYLDARYSYSALIDDSALIRLSDAEVAGYRAGGRDVIAELARGVHHSAPYRAESKYFARDLYRGSDGQPLRDAVSAAIADHTWAAKQRRRAEQDKITVAEEPLLPLTEAHRAASRKHYQDQAKWYKR